MPRRLSEEQVEMRKRLMREYVRKNYSANLIQKELQKRGLGIRRKDLLREIRRFRHIARKPEPEKYVPRKYRIWRVMFPPEKRIAIYGTVRSVSRRVELYGSGHQLYNAMARLSRYPPRERFVKCHALEVERHLDFNSRWDEHPSVLS